MGLIGIKENVLYDSILKNKILWKKFLDCFVIFEYIILCYMLKILIL